MTQEKLAAAYGFIVAVAMAIALFAISRDPSKTPAGRWLVRALDSWYLRTPWNTDATKRLRWMAWSAAILAAVMFFLLISNLPLRYRR